MTADILGVSAASPPFDYIWDRLWKQHTNYFSPVNSQTSEGLIEGHTLVEHVFSTGTITLVQDGLFGFDIHQYYFILVTAVAFSLLIGFSILFSPHVYVSNLLCCVKKSQQTRCDSLSKQRGAPVSDATHPGLSDIP